MSDENDLNFLVEDYDGGLMKCFIHIEKIAHICVQLCSSHIKKSVHIVGEQFSNVICI